MRGLEVVEMECFNLYRTCVETLGLAKNPRSRRSAESGPHFRTAPKPKRKDEINPQRFSRSSVSSQKSLARASKRW